MTVHLFGKVDSPCCANFALKKSAVDKSDTLHPSVVKTIDQDFYLDDFLKSHSSAEHLIDTTNTVISTLKQAGFRLTKLVSNSHDIIDKLPSTEIIDQTKISQTDSNQRILGILWDIQNDSYDQLRTSYDQLAIFIQIPNVEYLVYYRQYSTHWE